MSETCRVTAGEKAALLRAAFAYADLSRPGRAKALGVGPRHVTRYESGETPVPMERWEGVIEATGVPAWFFDTGFEVPPEPVEPTVAERVEALEGKLDTLRPADVAERLTALRAAVLELAAGNLEQTRRLLERPDTGRQQEP